MLKILVKAKRLQQISEDRIENDNMTTTKGLPCAGCHAHISAWIILCDHPASLELGLAAPISHMRKQRQSRISSFTHGLTSIQFATESLLSVCIKHGLPGPNWVGLCSFCLARNFPMGKWVVPRHSAKCIMDPDPSGMSPLLILIVPSPISLKQIESANPCDVLSITPHMVSV